jgi:PRTRC genetic system protein C
MAIDVKEVRRVFSYNGVTLPDVPGMEPREIRDLYSAQYPELISAEIVPGEVINGAREYTFRKAVGTKGGILNGGRLSALRATVQAEEQGTGSKLARALDAPATGARARAWGLFVDGSLRDRHEQRIPRVMPTSDMLAPLP